MKRLLLAPARKLTPQVSQNKYSRGLFVLAAACGLLLPAVGHAQAMPTGATVTASGSSVLMRRPTTLVLKVDLIGRGSTLKDALASLEKREKLARETLKSLGVDEASLEMGPASATDNAAQSAQMQMLLRQRLGGGRVPEGLKPANTVTATLPLTARWKLTGADANSLLTETQTLSKKIIAADLSGASDTAGISEEEQELLEEASEDSYDSYTGERNSAPGTPQIMFEASITSDERKGALREAFTAAQMEAQQLAEAAGMELADLANLQGSDGISSPEQAELYAYYGRYNAMRRDPRGNNPLVRVQPEFGEIPFSFKMQATFRLRPAAEKSE